MTPATAAFCPSPVRAITTPLTTTSPSEPAVTIKRVNGTRTAPCGASELAGCVPGTTESPVPAGTTGVVGGVTVILPQTATIAARVWGPTIPIGLTLFLA